ncbi:carboxylesterase family protein [Microbacterium sp. YMB-B2]|uniref:Carboxylic ester hydrolase n=1 Tax=Microbacterium tenebrionis TaxID=2830665 RepID=A0A9X1LLZ3_9MICO|nr:carboxylesterase family protein [Microbacterium tenebrionis]MCC2028119.1 carboxylesterase family protein [Microbacterium tenebrionis]
MTDSPVVETASGPVRGFWRDHGTPDASAAFLGIPFAKPPTGTLRFAAPVPPERWTEPLDATEYGATPLRITGVDNLIPEPAIPGKSTLNVNVFTPALDGALPVLVWIHGGGYTEGSPASPWYDGARFNRDGVVTVTISYRIGFDGFGHIEGAPANRGVLDWIAALEWVQQNIAAFGGDPSRVTIGGQSAGGGAVLTLLGMPQTQHLFHRAMSFSGALADVPLATAKARGRRLADLGGVSADVDGLRTLTERRIRQLQPQAATPRTGIGMVLDLLEDGLPWGPMIDGELIRRPAVDSLAEGVGADKPLLIGAADDEFTMVAEREGARIRWLPSWLLLLPFLRPWRVRRAYLAANRAQRRKGGAAMIGRFISDHVFRALVPRVAEARSRRSGGDADAGTWAYRFSWVSQALGWACHCLDVPFWFDGLDRERVANLAGEHPPQALADEMHAAAVAFIVGGNPGWPAWSSAPGIARVFGGDGADIAEDAYDSVLPLV